VLPCRSARDGQAVKLRDVDERHPVEVGGAVEAVEHLAGQVLRRVVVVTLVGEVFEFGQTSSFAYSLIGEPTLLSRTLG
jgi:hypothetical protein